MRFLILILFSVTDVITSAAIASGAVDAMSSSSSIHGDSISPMLAVHSSSPSLGGGGVTDAMQVSNGGGGNDGSDLSSNEGDLGMDSGDSG